MKKQHRIVGFRAGLKDYIRREQMMNFNQIRKMAKTMGVNTYRMKKTDIIRAIQKVEHNIECYGSERVTECMEDSCLWRGDCVSLGQGGRQY